MDIIQAIGDKRKYTLHAHTQFCDGKAPMEDFIKEAYMQGFELFGFTPHSPLPLDSPCNMSKDDVPKYLAEVERLRKEYPTVPILAGMEIDYLGPQWGATSDYFKQLPLDYTISSIHFIPSQDGVYVDIDGRYESFKAKMAQYFHDDIRYVVETFFAQSMAMVEAGGFDIIGHFDKIKHNGSLYMPQLQTTPWYAELVDALVDKIIDKGLIVEINTKAWREHQQLFPDQKLWRRLVLAGVPIIVNSDAHYPRLIDASRNEAFAALNYLKNKELTKIN